MRKILLGSFFLAGLLGAQTKEEKPKISAEENTRRSSLALGYQEGIRASRKQMKAEDFDGPAFLEGFLLGIKNEKLALSPEEIREAMSVLQTKLSAREEATAAANLKAGEKFLADNKNKQGVITGKSGLQYRVKDAGEGEPYGIEKLQNSEILVHFRGTLPDGREFASSGEVEPATIRLDDVIPGFREALALMSKGARWTIFVPSDLAYGEQRRSSDIGPNQLLIFDIELVDVSSPDPGEE